MAGQRIVMEMILDDLLRWWHDGGESVEGLPHINRLDGNVNRT